MNDINYVIQALTVYIENGSFRIRNLSFERNREDSPGWIIELSLAETSRDHRFLFERTVLKKMMESPLFEQPIWTVDRKKRSKDDNEFEFVSENDLDAMMGDAAIVYSLISFRQILSWSNIEKTLNRSNCVLPINTEIPEKRSGNYIHVRVETVNREASHQEIMSQDLVPLLRFRCKYCGKFYSSQNHRCRFKGRNNCLSCEHLSGFRITIVRMGDTGKEFIKNKEIICDKGHEMSLRELAQEKKWVMHCKDHQLVQGYKNKEDYLKRIHYFQQFRIEEEEPTVEDECFPFY